MEMTLSSAIRLGAMMKPQGFSGTDTKKSCVLRAACDAVGLEYCIDGELSLIPYVRLEAMFPILEQEQDCPVCTVKLAPLPLTTICYHLNDTHRWTREQIAAYVELLEPQPLDDLFIEQMAQKEIHEQVR